jgi:hypothetical protein
MPTSAGPTLCDRRSARRVEQSQAAERAKRAERAESRRVAQSSADGSRDPARRPVGRGPPWEAPGAGPTREARVVGLPTICSVSLPSASAAAISTSFASVPLLSLVFSSPTHLKSPLISPYSHVHSRLPSTALSTRSVTAHAYAYSTRVTCTCPQPRVSLDAGSARRKLRAEHTSCAFPRTPATLVRR